jgi:hypothetical protein
MGHTVSRSVRGAASGAARGLRRARGGAPLVVEQRRQAASSAASSPCAPRRRRRRARAPRRCGAGGRRPRSAAGRRPAARVERGLGQGAVAPAGDREVGRGPREASIHEALGHGTARSAADLGAHRLEPARTGGVQHPERAGRRLGARRDARHGAVERHEPCEPPMTSVRSASSGMPSARRASRAGALSRAPGRGHAVRARGSRRRSPPGTPPPGARGAPAPASPGRARRWSRAAPAACGSARAAALPGNDGEAAEADDRGQVASGGPRRGRAPPPPAPGRARAGRGAGGRTCRRDADERQPAARTSRGLHAARGAEDEHLGAARGRRVRQRHGRVDVAAAAAGREQQPRRGAGAAGAVTGRRSPCARASRKAACMKPVAIDTDRRLLKP